MRMPGKNKMNIIIGKKRSYFFIIAEHLIFAIKLINRAWGKQGVMSNCNHFLSCFSAISYLFFNPIKLFLEIAVKAIFPAYAVIIKCKKPCFFVKLRNVRKRFCVLCYCIVKTKIAVNFFKFLSCATFNNIFALFV